MERIVRDGRRRAALLVISTLMIAGCSGGAQTDSGGGLAEDLVEFPAEKRPAEFPGLSYPVHNGDLPQPAGPVWLIAVDGATWDVIRPLAARGELPHLTRLMELGAHGVMLSEEPTISPALWATIATGVPRFEHGIVDFTVKLHGTYMAAETGPLDRRSPAVWELVGAAGGRSAVIGWFGSYPAEEIAGYYVSKRFDPEKPDPDKIHPPSLLQLLVEQSMVRLRRGDAESIARTPFLQETLVEDARRMADLRVIAAREQTDFLAVYFSGIDVVQHVAWRHMDPASQQFLQDGPVDPNLVDVIPSYYRYIDHTLGEIVELAPEGTTFMIVSDHGGGPLMPEDAYHLQLRVLLEQLGLMRENAGTLWTGKELRRHDKQIWINVRGVEPEGSVPPEQALETAREVRRRLQGLRTDSGEPVFASLIDHTESGRWQPGEPAFTVRFSVHALVTSEVRDGDRRFDFSPVRLRRPDVSGDHRPEGIVVVAGPSIRAAELSRPANIYQVAPTLLYLLGLPQDRRMLRFAPPGGGVMLEALNPDALESRPVRMIAAYPGTDRTAFLASHGRGAEPAREIDPEREEALQKLRSLGYIQ